MTGLARNFPQQHPTIYDTYGYPKEILQTDLITNGYFDQGTQPTDVCHGHQLGLQV